MLEGKIKQRIINSNKEPTEKVKFLWNMIGSGFFSASAMFLSLVVIKMSGAEMGGEFAISLTIGQIVLCIAYFEMRTFQVTDVKNEFSFREYHMGKLLLCGVSVMSVLFYLVMQGYDFEKSSIIFLVCFARFLDGYADVYEAQFQKDGRLDLAGKSLTYRTLWYVCILCLMLFITKKLILSLLVADLAALFLLWQHNIRMMKRFRKIQISFQWSKIIELLKKCAPLFVGSFCWTYILSASRMAIDANMSSEYQAYFQIIFMPVSVISLFASFVFKPMLPKLSYAYSSGNNNEFYGTIRNGIIGIGGITIVGMMLAYAIGIPVLSFFSGCMLDQYRGMLVFLILAGGFNAVSFIMYYVLTIVRCYKGVLIGYILSAVLGLFISSPLVKKAGMLGASWSYFIVVIALCTMFVMFIWRKINQDKKIETTSFKKDVVE